MEEYHRGVHLRPESFGTERLQHLVIALPETRPGHVHSDQPFRSQHGRLSRGAQQGYGASELAYDLCLAP